MASVGTGIDSLRLHLSGAYTIGAPQLDPEKSLGGARSGTLVEPLRVHVVNMPVGLWVVRGGGSGVGLVFLDSDGTGQVRCSDVGGSSFGDWVTVSAGSQALVTGPSLDTWFIVERAAGVTPIGNGLVQLIEPANGVFGGAEIDNAAQTVRRRAVVLHNFLSGTDITGVKVWVAGDLADNTRIAMQAQTVEPGATFPSGPHSGETAEDLEGRFGQLPNETALAPVPLTNHKSGNKLSVGTIEAGDSVAIWYELDVPAAFTAAGFYDVQLHVSYRVSGTYYTQVFYDGVGVYGAVSEQYGVWVGENAQPDVDTAADKTFNAFPVNIDTVAMSANNTYNLVVRQRNGYGLWGASSPVATVELDGSGDPYAVRPGGPAAVQLFPAALGKVGISAVYFPGNDSDVQGNVSNLSDLAAIRATDWVYWLSADGAAPDMDNDAETAEVSMWWDGVDENSALNFEQLNVVSSAQFYEGQPVYAGVRTRRSGSPDVDSNNVDTYSVTAVWNAGSAPEIYPNRGDSYGQPRGVQSVDTTVVFNTAANGRIVQRAGRSEIWIGSTLVLKMKWYGAGDRRNGIISGMGMKIASSGLAGAVGSMETFGCPLVYDSGNNDLLIGVSGMDGSIVTGIIADLDTNEFKLNTFKMQALAQQPDTRGPYGVFARWTESVFMVFDRETGDYRPVAELQSTFDLRLSVPYVVRDGYGGFWVDESRDIYLEGDVDFCDFCWDDLVIFRTSGTTTDMAVQTGFTIDATYAGGGASGEADGIEVESWTESARSFWIVVSSNRVARIDITNGVIECQGFLPGSTLGAGFSLSGMSFIAGTLFDASGNLSCFSLEAQPDYGRWVL